MDKKDSFKYTSVKYEGQYQSILDLIKSREWKVDVKEIEDNTVYMKIPQDIEEEINFYQNVEFDEKTRTKFFEFKPITEEEFQNAEELAHSEEYIEEENNNKAEERKTEIKKETNVNELKKSVLDKYTEEMGLNKLKTLKSLKKEKEGGDDEKEKLINNNGNKMKALKMNFDFKLKGYNEIKDDMFGKFNDPYDYFFSKNYLMSFIIVAIILVLLGF